jgi:hypothetical protein
VSAAEGQEEFWQQQQAQPSPGPAQPPKSLAWRLAAEEPPRKAFAPFPATGRVGALLARAAGPHAKALARRMHAPRRGLCFGPQGQLVFPDTRGGVAVVPLSLGPRPVAAVTVRCRVPAGPRSRWLRTSGRPDVAGRVRGGGGL